MIVPKDRRSPFVRLGRSLLVNQTYLTHINVLKQRLTLSDNQELPMCSTCLKHC